MRKFLQSNKLTSRRALQFGDAEQMPSQQDEPLPLSGIPKDTRRYAPGYTFNQRRGVKKSF